MASPSPITMPFLDNMQQQERRGKAFTSYVPLYQREKSFLEAQGVLLSVLISSTPHYHL